MPGKCKKLTVAIQVASRIRQFKASADTGTLNTQGTMNSFKENRTGYILIIATLVISVCLVFNLSPIAQDTAYHAFSDQNTHLGIPNFYNVLSNLPFLIAGLYGLYSLLISKKIYGANEFRLAYIILFSAVALVSVGSGYYHLTPGNQTLVWDRIPIAIGIMALLSIVISEFISLNMAHWLLLPLITTGVLSVYYWQSGESIGQGDLRLYVLVQYLSALLIAIILLNFKSRYTGATGYWWILACYALAKLLEYFDKETDLLTGIISGHPLKHIVVATGMYILILYYRDRQLIEK